MSRTSDRTYRRNRAIVLAQSDICWLCGRPGADSADHIIPVRDGGSDAVTNLRPAHIDCNRKRGTKDVADVNILRTSADW